VAIVASDQVTLPVGLEVNGVRYRQVVIDEIRAGDAQLGASRATQNNAAKGLTLMLRRIIQAIPGLLDKKENPSALISEEFVRNMLVVDREYLLLCTNLLSREPTFTQVFDHSDSDASVEKEIDIRTLEVFGWPEDEAPRLLLDLGRELKDVEGNPHTQVYYYFPNGKNQEQMLAEPEERAMFTSLAACLRGENGEHFYPERLEALPGGVILGILQAVKENMPGADLTVALEAEDSRGRLQKWEGRVDIHRFFSTGNLHQSKVKLAGSSGPKRKKMQ